MKTIRGVLGVVLATGLFSVPMTVGAAGPPTPQAPGPWTNQYFADQATYAGCVVYQDGDF